MLRSRRHTRSPRRMTYRPELLELESRIVPAAPVNDLFANAIALDGFAAATTGSILDATVETGEPSHPMGYTNSIWWKWTAPEAGNLAIDTFSGTVTGDVDTVLEVYVANDPDNPAVNALALIASNDDANAFGESQVQFASQKGTTYYIAVTGAPIPLFTTHTVHLNVNLRPFNDNFADATSLSGVFVTATGYNNNATGQAGEPNHAGASGTANSVWWSWTAPESGRTVVDTIGSSFNTTLGVYTGTAVNALTTIGSNDNVSAADVPIDPDELAAFPNLRSLVAFDAVAGQTYHFAVDGTAANVGPVTLNLTMVRNDQFANAEELTGPSDLAIGTLVGASRETGEPIHAGVNYLNTRSIWYKYTAAQDGVVVLDTFGDSLQFDSVLAVYTANDPDNPTVNNLTHVASNNDAGDGGVDSQIILAASAGRTYYIAVAGRYMEQFDTTRSIALRLQEMAAAPNDDLADALPFLETRAVTGVVTGSSPVGWWFFPGNNLYPVRQFDTFGSNFDTTLTVYSAPAGSTVDSLDDLALVAFNNDADSTPQSRVLFATSNAFDYYIAVGGSNGSTGQAALNWSFPTFNDHFADAWPIMSGVSQYVVFDPVGSPPRVGVEIASNEVGEPNHAGAAANAQGNFASVWWKFTAPTSGTISLDTFGSGFDTVLGVYRANNPANPAVNDLVEVASNDNAGAGVQSQVMVNATAATDYWFALAGKNGIGGFAAINLLFTPAQEALTASMTSTAPLLTNSSPIPVTITFNNSVSNFDSDDLVVSNASISNFAGNDLVYTFDLIPLDQGMVTVTLPAGAVQDAFGSLNPQASLSRTFDSVAPTATMTSTAPDPTSTSPILVTVTFSENVTGFLQEDLVVVNGTIGDFIAVSGSIYTFSLTPIGQGLVTVDLPASSAADAAGNGNVAATTFSRTYEIVQSGHPTVLSLIRKGPEQSNKATVRFKITFSEPVSGVDVSDFQLILSGNITGASVVSVKSRQEGRVYIVEVNSGQGVGTLGLLLVDNDSIVDADGNPLGGTGLGNGDFTDPDQVFTFTKKKRTGSG